jgi:hypothetical protein
LQVSDHILKLLILILQLLNPFVFFSHSCCLAIILGNKCLILIIDLVSLAGLVPDLFDFLSQTTQLVTLVNDDLSLTLISTH